MTVLEARMVDATHLELTEPVDLPRGSRLVVSVVEADEETEERRQWLGLGQGSFLRFLQTPCKLPTPTPSLTTLWIF